MHASPERNRERLREGLREGEREKSVRTQERGRGGGNGARKQCIVGERRDETRRDETQTRQNETRRDPDETRDETRPRLGESGENGENGTLVSYWTVISSLGISHPRYAVPFGNSKDIYIYRWCFTFFGY